MAERMTAPHSSNGHGVRVIVADADLAPAHGLDPEAYPVALAAIATAVQTGTPAERRERLGMVPMGGRTGEESAPCGV